MTDEGNYWNGSGTGNEFNTQYPMVRKFIVDSLVYWVTEYGVDGFRFDLMGLIDLETMKAIREVLHNIDPTILIYGEPWVAAPSGLTQLTDKKILRGTNIGAFNDHFRDAIKGDTRGPFCGYVQDGTRREGVINGFRGAIFDWALQPTEVITYSNVHDDLCLWDKIKISTPELSSTEWKKMQKLSAVCVLTAQGIPLLFSGEEICRTKQGEDNSYNSGDEINQIRWEWKKQNRDVFEYYKGLIALRKAHPVFRLPIRQEIEKRVTFPPQNLPFPKSLVVSLDGKKLEGESADRILILINPEPKSQKFTLPKGRWQIVVDERQAGTQPLREVSVETTVAPRSAQILLKTQE
jgi:pullulanase